MIETVASFGLAAFFLIGAFWVGVFMGDLTKEEFKQAWTWGWALTLFFVWPIVWLVSIGENN